MAVTPITDWQTRLRERLYEQFKDLPGWLSIVDAIAARVQALEDAIVQCYTITSIDESEGVQLDVLGRIVGEQRAGKTDAVYRLYIRAKICANRSSVSIV